VFGWVAAAAVGLFIGAQSMDQEATESASPDTTEAENTPNDSASMDAEDETLALAVGSFTELEEEP
jgi:hypothetical protein